MREDEAPTSPAAATEVGSGYYLNMAAHDAFHRRRKGLLASLFERSMRRHDVHHRGIEANFGLCFGVWDRLFGTYREGLGHRA